MHFYCRHFFPGNTVIIILDNFPPPPPTLQGVGLGGRKNPRIILGENYCHFGASYSLMQWKESQRFFGSPFQRLGAPTVPALGGICSEILGERFRGVSGFALDFAPQLLNHTRGASNQDSLNQHHYSPCLFAHSRCYLVAVSWLYSVTGQSDH